MEHVHERRATTQIDVSIACRNVLHCVGPAGQKTIWVTARKGIQKEKKTSIKKSSKLRDGETPNLAISREGNLE